MDKLNSNLTESDLIELVKNNSKNNEIIEKVIKSLDNNILSVLLTINCMKFNKKSVDEIKNYLENSLKNEYINSIESGVTKKLIHSINNIFSEVQYSYIIKDNTIKFVKSPHNYSKIRDNLYASAIPSKEHHWLFFEQTGITDVITLMEKQIDDNLIKLTNINCHYFYVDDLKAPTNEQMIEICNVINKSDKTLVHCFGGVGRTGTVLSAYLMFNEKLTRLQALDNLSGRKTIISDSQEIFLRNWYSSCINENIIISKPKIKLPQFIIFVGYPASGKSTLALAIEQSYKNVVRINQDEIRQKNKCEELVGKNIKTHTVLLDRCNLTKEERSYWLSIAFNPKTWCIFFNSDIEDCKYRITKRKNHPTVKEGHGLTILNSLDGKLENPSLDEGFDKIIVINNLEESDDLIESWGLVKPKIEIPDENLFIIKFPRTKHIVNVGSASRDDLIMTDNEVKNFLGVEIYVEEKIDGANLGISIGLDNKIMVQNRSHYVTSKEHAQFKLLDKWIQSKSSELWQVIEPGRHILYGEWVYMRHSIKYDNLPDYFVAFDLYDKIEKKFYSRNRLEELLKNTTITLIPLVYRGIYKKKEELVSLINLTSKFYDGKLEGIYCRVCDDDYLLYRGKIVRSDFICGSGLHWSKGNLEVNAIGQDFG